MSSINTNLSAITALQALKSTQTAMNKNQSQISTGLRVGEASHNASYWSISTKMKSDNGALGAVKDSIKQSKAMIDTYTSAIDKSLKFLDTMKTKLTAGSNPGADLKSIQLELKSSINGLKSTTGSAVFNGQNWIKGEAQDVKLVTSYDATTRGVTTLDINTADLVLFEDPEDGTGGILNDVAAIDISNAGQASYSNITVGAGDLTKGSEIKFKLDGAEMTFKVTTQDTVDDLVKDINKNSTLSGLVLASKNTDGSLRLTSKVEGKDLDTTFGKAEFYSKTPATATTEGVVTLDTAGFAAGDKIKFSIGGGSEQTFTIGAEADADAIATAINADGALGALVTAAVDSDGRLTLTTASVNQAIDGSFVEFADAADTAHTPGSGTSVRDALEDVAIAIEKLTAASATLGANKALLETQEEFIGVLSDSLTAGVSAFVDADMNEVSTRNQALQTQQQLGVQALSMANQNSQMILKLFQ